MARTADFAGVCRVSILGILIIAAVAMADAPSPTSKPVASPYSTAHDVPLEATEKPGPKKANYIEPDRYAQFRVDFNGIRGDRVPAYFYLPAQHGVPDVSHERPAVLLEYGSGGTKDANYIVAMGEQFVAHGFAVLTIDVPNRGERNTHAAKTNPFGGTFVQTLGDYSRATDYLCTRPEVDANRLAYVGISWGAITGVPYVAHDPRIKVMVSMVGGGSFTGMIPGDITAETRKAATAIDPVFHVGLIAPRPLLLLNVTHDLLVPRAMSEALHKAAGDGATKMWLETDHFFNGVDRKWVGEIVVSFVEQGLSK